MLKSERKPMTELEISLFAWPNQDLDRFQSLLNQFEEEKRCQVRVRVLPWETGYADLINFALHGEGPDISEVGTTWIPSLLAMNVLRPFTHQEVAALGGSSAFLPSAWQTCLVPGDNRVWAIPRLADVRAVYYRRDFLEKAAVDEHTAFLTHQQFIRTLERLQEIGIENPIIIPTHNIIHPSLHYLASWIWAAGGRILSEDGKHCLLNSQESQAGIRAHLELSQYLSPTVRGLDPYQSDDFFWDGGAAVTLTLRTPILSRLEPVAGEHLIPLIGAVPVLGNSFIGGSNHVVWKHVPPAKERFVLELLQFLSDSRAQGLIGEACGLFPPREDRLNAEPFTDPFYNNVIPGLRAGRSFPSTSAWGKVENLLLYTLSRLWETTISEPQVDLTEVVAVRTEDLTRRIDMILQSYHRE
jgi:multiple sugar transport system substrate-binding protein